MITLYNVDKELYYQLYACVIDIHDEWEDYEVTPQLFEDMQQYYDSKRKAYRISNEFWEDFKTKLDDWISSDGYFRTYDEEKHYEIYTATPYYKVYDKTGELINENYDETLEDIKDYYGNITSDSLEDYTLVPIDPEECEFRCKLQKWSGDY